MEVTANMARAAWPWTLMVVLAAAVVAATVAITALLLLVRGLSRLGRSARSSATSSTVRPSSNGQRADQQPSRPLDGSEQGTASPPRQTTHGGRVHDAPGRPGAPRRPEGQRSADMGQQAARRSARVAMGTERPRRPVATHPQLLIKCNYG
jgi:hypothetical protein